MLKDINVRDKEVEIPLYPTINKMKVSDKQLIEKQKERIVELKNLYISRTFELDILYHFIRVMGVETEYQQFKEGYLEGMKTHAN